MSLTVKCVITVTESAYEAGSVDANVINESEWMATTGTFSKFSREFLDKSVQGVATGAVDKTLAKLRVIKGSK